MNKVKEYRTLAKMSQLELAKKVGVARQTINLIENQSIIHLWIYALGLQKLWELT
ncbi:helix-turn-helix family protein [[Clostridium] sordellii ATCC 9714]|nr:helix-turn-helix family protein [[Clostridium] sordellii ATCC 9714] [Paeniclostridium sordellii ATCC 9714]